MKQADCISHYISEESEATIIKALRLLATASASGDEYSAATDLADALENDTFLLQTTTPPELKMRGIDWPNIAEGN